MKRLFIPTVIFLLALATSVSAFDGNRKGFVLGGGLGFGPSAKVTVSVGSISASDENSGLAIDFLIGYAWDEQNMIVFLRDGIIYSEEMSHSTTISIVQGFSGIGYFHYFGEVGKSFFITGGLGLQDWTSLDENYSSPDPGVGLLLGGGYEFTRHLQVYSSLSFGKTSEGSFKNDHSQFIIVISAVAF